MPTDAKPPTTSSERPSFSPVDNYPFDPSQDPLIHRQNRGVFRKHPKTVMARSATRLSPALLRLTRHPNPHPELRVGLHTGLHAGVHAGTRAERLQSREQNRIPDCVQRGRRRASGRIGLHAEVHAGHVQSCEPNCNPRCIPDCIPGCESACQERAASMTRRPTQSGGHGAVIRATDR